MNTDTGQIYRQPQEIANALSRGEPLVPVSPKVSRLSRRDRVRVGNTMANLKRTRPNLSDDEREALALKMCRR